MPLSIFFFNQYLLWIRIIAQQHSTCLINMRSQVRFLVRNNLKLVHFRYTYILHSSYEIGTCTWYILLLFPHSLPLPLTPLPLYLQKLCFHLFHFLSSFSLHLYFPCHLNKNLKNKVFKNESKINIYLAQKRYADGQITCEEMLHIMTSGKCTLQDTPSTHWNGQNPEYSTKCQSACDSGTDGNAKESSRLGRQCALKRVLQYDQAIILLGI